MQAEPVWPLGAQLGEGPLWADDEAALWFTDIEGRTVHRFHPASGARASFAVDGRPGFIVLAGEGYVVGIERQLRRFDGARLGAVVADVPAATATRLNDATVDAHGGLWFGSMDIGCAALTGAVHRFDGVAPVRTVGGRCAIPNGPAVSADGRTLYHVDTLAGTIHAFDIAVRDELMDGRVFAAIDPADGVPDGVVLDAEGCLWVALWGGWGVRRYDPDGALMLVVPVPCAQVTKLAFGGADLRTAYVTTARTGLDAAASAAQPLAGALFAFEASAPGLAAHRMVSA